MASFLFSFSLTEKIYNKSMRDNLFKLPALIPVLAALALIGFGGYEYGQLISAKRNAAILENKIRGLEGELSQAKTGNASLSENLSAEQTKSNFLEEQINGLRSAVSTLENLNKTDRELLKKYSKVYFLNENYKPVSLADIDSKYVYEKNKMLQIHAKVWPYLKKLFEAAEQDGAPLQIISAYRSFGEQAVLKTGYTMVFGQGTASQFSADQGYSEHQLGTTVDFTTPGLGLNFTKFENAGAYKWLGENAHKYGFILSYPKENSYFKFEPWHWRFVGADLAATLHFSNKHFYDLDQRLIDLYLISIFN